MSSANNNSKYPFYLQFPKYPRPETSLVENVYGKPLKNIYAKKDATNWLKTVRNVKAKRNQYNKNIAEMRKGIEEASKITIKKQPTNEPTMWGNPMKHTIQTRKQHKGGKRSTHKRRRTYRK